MNNKGFTLIELIATIVLLAIVVSIASFSIVSIIKNSKIKNYEILIDNIKGAAEVYYQECKYANNSDISCNSNAGSYTLILGDLVKYGDLKGNSTDKNKNYSLVNTLNDEDITACEIVISFSNGKVNITAKPGGNSNCPTTNEYATGKMDDGRL